MLKVDALSAIKSPPQNYALSIRAAFSGLIRGRGGLIYERDPVSGQAFAQFKIGDGRTGWNSLDYVGRLNILSDSDGNPISLEDQTLDAARQALERAAGAEDLAAKAQAAAVRAESFCGTASYV
ncbi:hypothetical protein C4J81_01995 [Deltaproteobacteria bacterium Smac51]|nr:hypothetical protein C4J81_01995 [Deltaproteobacteria bacterium Smac51]